MTTVATEGRPYVQRERRLLSEYLARNYPNARAILNQRLGAYPLHVAAPLPPNVPPSALSSFRRYVDALVIEPERLTMIEAKIIQAPGAAESLELYSRLLPSTPELAPYLHLPLKKLVVAAVTDPVLSAMAAERGIETVTFTPAWVFSDLMETEFNTRPPKLKAPTPIGGASA